MHRKQVDNGKERDTGETIGCLCHKYRVIMLDTMHQNAARVGCYIFPVECNSQIG